jgi:hypothetical protein
MNKRIWPVVIGLLVLIGVVFLVVVISKDDGVENIGEGIEELGDDIQDATD